MKDTQGADALIQALAAEGRVESHGAFSVDASRAQALLKSFRLSDPHTFVLAFAQVAVLGGATRLSAEITGRRVVLSFDGEPLSLETLAQAAGALHVSGSSRAERRLAALAEGVFGAEALDASRLEIVSQRGPNSGGAELERRPGQPDQLRRRPAKVERQGPPVGSEAGAESPSTARSGSEAGAESPSMARSGAESPSTARAESPSAAFTCVTVERVTSARDAVEEGWAFAEARWLGERGCYAPLALTVNGRAVSRNRDMPHAHFVTPVTGSGVEGMAGVDHAPSEARWLIVQDGVVISEEPLEAAPEGFVAVVEAPAVRRDLGLFRAVQNRAYTEAKDAVMRAVTRALDAARRVLTRGRKLRDVVTQDLAHRTLRTAFLRGAFAGDRLFENLPIWTLLGRRLMRQQVPLSTLRSLARSKGGLVFLTVPPESMSAAARSVLERRRGALLLGDPREGELLGQRLGAPLRSLDALLTCPPPPSFVEGVRRLGGQIWWGIHAAMGLLFAGFVVSLLFTLSSRKWLLRDLRSTDLPEQLTLVLGMSVLVLSFVLVFSARHRLSVAEEAAARAREAALTEQLKGRTSKARSPGRKKKPRSKRRR